MDADMGVVAAEVVVVVVVGVGEARRGEFGSESGSLRVVAFEDEEEAEDVVGVGGVWVVCVVLRCWLVLVVGSWLLVLVDVIGYWLLVVGCCWFASLC